MITKSGFTKLDALLGGGLPAGLISVGAGGSLGVTSFLLTAGLNVTTGGNPAGVAIFAPATTRAATVATLIGMAMGIPRWHYSIIKPGVPAWPKAKETAKKASAANIYVDDTPDLKIEDLCTRVEALHAQGVAFGLIIVDDMHLVSIKRRPYVAGGTNLGEELLDRLRELALKIAAPVICSFKVSSRTRNFLERGNLDKIEIPKSISKVSDVVLLLSRDDMLVRSVANVAGYLVKNNSGQCGRLDLAIDEAGRFHDGEAIVVPRITEGQDEEAVF